MLIKFLRKKRHEYSIAKHRKKVLSAIRNGLKLGKNVTIMDGVRFDPPHNGLIEIGENTTIAPEVIFIAHDASMFKPIGLGRLGYIKIGADCFVGARSVLLPGIKIGSNVIIGSGSVVSKDIPENSIAAGNPARVVGDYSDYLKRQSDRAKEYPVFGYDEFYKDIKSSLNQLSDSDDSKRLFFTKGQSSKLRSSYRFNVDE